MDDSHRSAADIEVELEWIFRYGPGLDRKITDRGPAEEKSEVKSKRLEK